MAKTQAPTRKDDEAIAMQVNACGACAYKLWAENGLRAALQNASGIILVQDNIADVICQESSGPHVQGQGKNELGVGRAYS